MKFAIRSIAVLTAVLLLFCAAFPVSAETAVEYKVRHYVQKNGSDEYQYMYIDRLSGVAGAFTEAVAKDLFGYKVEAFSQKEIAADGSTVITIYYTKAYALGDVNCDGMIDMLDMAYMERYIAEWDGYDDTNVCPYAADCYINYKVTANDALLLKRYLAGIEDAQFGTLSESGNKEDGFGPWV